MYERTYHKAVLKTESEPQKKRRRINWKLLVRLLVAVAIVVGVIVLICLPRLQVKTVTVAGANVVDPADVSAFVQQHLQGHELLLLPKTSIFLIHEHSLALDIKQHFSRLQTVSVKRTTFSSLTVTVTEYQGVALWCSDETTCYFMDQNGVVFAPAPYFSGDAYPKIFDGTFQHLPFQAITADQNAAVSLLMARLPIIGIMPEEFHFASSHELDIVFNHNGSQATLLFDPTTDTNEALVALYTGLRTNPLATKYQDPTQVLQYIDLRFENRVVYKFQ
jgi:cell division septal protein FtsQ